MYDDKEKVKGIEKLIYPLVIVNYKRIEKIIHTEEELYEHILCEKRLKDIILFIAAGIHPISLITRESLGYLLLSNSINEYGIQFFYKSVKKMEYSTYQALQIINGEINKYESEHIKNMKSESKSIKT